jgi:hypothetical protein
MIKNIFTKEVMVDLIDRINNLTPTTQPQWGKMNVAQMLAHCNVAYEMIFEPEKHPRPNALMRFFIKLMAKKAVVNDQPYPKNSRTAPAFLVSSEKDFNNEKTRLIDYLKRVQELGGDHFHNLESHSFGPLTTEEWSNLFYKHLDHHLQQFRV